MRCTAPVNLCILRVAVCREHCAEVAQYKAEGVELRALDGALEGALANQVQHLTALGVGYRLCGPLRCPVISMLHHSSPCPRMYAVACLPAATPGALAHRAGLHHPGVGLLRRAAQLWMRGGGRVCRCDLNPCTAAALSLQLNLAPHHSCPSCCHAGWAGRSSGGGAAGGDDGSSGEAAQFVSNASFATLSLIYAFSELLDLSDRVSCGGGSAVTP